MESPSHGFAVPAPLRQGGRGDGGCGLPQPVTSVTGLAMTRFFARGTVGFFVVRRGGALPLPRAGKSAKRCRWQRKRAGFEEVPRLAATTVAGNRLARRWAREPRPYGSVTGGAMGGRPQGSPLRRAARNVWAGYRPLRKFFDREGMVCFGFWWRRMTRAPGC